MTTIFIRTLIVYLLLVVTMKLMGKRQIGELELSELVTTFLLSEIAALPITNQEIPVSYAVIPIVTLLMLEVTISMLTVKSVRVKRFLHSKPGILIERGVLRPAELSRARITLEELLSEFRQKGVTDISEVYYAILERNGKITIIPRSEDNPPTLRQLKIPTAESGMMHLLVSDGDVNEFNLSLLGLDRNWLDVELKRRGCPLKDVLYLMRDDAGKILFMKKE